VSDDLEEFGQLNFVNMLDDVPPHPLLPQDTAHLSLSPMLSSNVMLPPATVISSSVPPPGGGGGGGGGCGGGVGDQQQQEQTPPPPAKIPRRKPGARECMQISRRFGVNVIPQKYMDVLLDYCTRGKVEHLIRMRERLDEHSKMLESQLAGLEALAREKGDFFDASNERKGDDKMV